MDKRGCVYKTSTKHEQRRWTIPPFPPIWRPPWRCCIHLKFLGFFFWWGAGELTIFMSHFIILLPNPSVGSSMMKATECCWKFTCKFKILSVKSLMAEWVRAGVLVTWMYCHDLEVMSSNPGRVELGVYSTSVLSHTWTPPPPPPKKKKKKKKKSSHENDWKW